MTISKDHDGFPMVWIVLYNDILDFLWCTITLDHLIKLVRVDIESLIKMDIDNITRSIWRPDPNVTKVTKVIFRIVYLFRFSYHCHWWWRRKGLMHRQLIIRNRSRWGRCVKYILGGQGCFKHMRNAVMDDWWNEVGCPIEWGCGQCQNLYKKLSMWLWPWLWLGVWIFLAAFELDSLHQFNGCWGRDYVSRELFTLIGNIIAPASLHPWKDST
jgi:hypothetical protein